ncbi:MAG: SDR family NAD(P)-dependent oxidoreductase [Gammaproteobacteria bacterium]|nr:SDR family NAD(P)-dependent oxidoreductase [Gammaproteobacteria bacterium]
MAEPATVLISGASSGIGQATSRLLLDQGYRVIGLSRRGQIIEFENDDFDGITIDLEDLDRLESRLGEIIQSNEIDCFVHAAGRGCFGSIEQFSIAQIEASLRLNLTSAMVICRSLVPEFRRRGKGRLIFIGSESALDAGKKGALYCAAKFGLRGFCQSLRDDCASDGIQASLINPGMVRSPFFDDLPFEPGKHPENAIAVTDVAEVVWQIIRSSPNIIIDEVNLSPRVKSINFGKSP